MKVNFNKTEIPEISQKLLDKILKMNNKCAKVVAFSGELGAGKTTLIQELARRLGIKENIISPTFVIMKIYKINPSSIYYSYFKKLIHIDAYRLDSPIELLKIRWHELQSNKDNLIIIEWPEKVREYVSSSVLRVALTHVDDINRFIEF